MEEPMSPMQTIEAPITGREAIGDTSEPVAALAQFYRAINGRDLALMAENWDHAEDVAMDNPLGGIKRGWPEIRAVYERIFHSPARVQVEFHDYTLHVIGDVFYTVGRERGTFAASGTKLNLAIRTSRIFRRVGDCWRQIHHHGSIDDPQLLSAYQQAVR
jgi:ketosteroid isomerase-like protein